MWTTILNTLFKNLIIPLLTTGVLAAWKWWNEKQEDGSRNDDLDSGFGKIKEAKTDEERKKALDEFMRGIGSLRV